MLTDKAAFITGASLGIGRGIALGLAQAGADVCVNYYTHPEAAESLAAEIRALGRRCLLSRCDVADQAAVEESVAMAVREFGKLDIAVTNAAYSDREPFTTADMAGFHRTIDVTMWGAFYALRAAAQQMIAAGRGGSIVVISSPHAYTPVPRSMAYNMAKAALDQMARTAAIELVDHRIRVNLIHPGWIDTPGERKFMPEETLQSAARKLPWQRLGQPAEIARGVVFLCEDASDYLTGSGILIDGGITLPWHSKSGTVAE